MHLGLPDLDWIIEVLATQRKFLGPSRHYTVINCIFTFCWSTNILACDYDVMMAQLKFSNLTTLYVHLYDIQITHGVQQSTIYQHINYHDTTNHSLNCFSHVIEVLQISTYENIAKLLTQPSSDKFVLLILTSDVQWHPLISQYTSPLDLGAGLGWVLWKTSNFPSVCHWCNPREGH